MANTWANITDWLYPVGSFFTTVATLSTVDGNTVWTPTADPADYFDGSWDIYEKITMPNSYAGWTPIAVDPLYLITYKRIA